MSTLRKGVTSKIALVSMCLLLCGCSISIGEGKTSGKDAHLPLREVVHCSGCSFVDAQTCAIGAVKSMGYSLNIANGGFSAIKRTSVPPRRVYGYFEPATFGYRVPFAVEASSPVKKSMIAADFTSHMNKCVQRLAARRTEP